MLYYYSQYNFIAHIHFRCNHQAHAWWEWALTSRLVLPWRSFIFTRFEKCCQWRLHLSHVFSHALMLTHAWWVMLASHVLLIYFVFTISVMYSSWTLAWGWIEILYSHAATAHVTLPYHKWRQRNRKVGGLCSPRYKSRGASAWPVPPVRPFLFCRLICCRIWYEV